MPHDLDPSPGPSSVTKTFSLISESFYSASGKLPILQKYCLHSVSKVGSSHEQNTYHNLLLNSGFAKKVATETGHRIERCGPRTEEPGTKSQELG